MCSHIMLLLLYVSYIQCKCFYTGTACHGKQTGTMNEWTNKGVCVGCWMKVWMIQTAAKFLIHLYKICKQNLSNNVKLLMQLRLIVCGVKYVNSFARRQHLFEIVAKPTAADIYIMSHPAPLSLFQVCQKRNHLICSGYWYLPWISLKSIQNPCKGNEKNLARDGRWDG